VRKDATEIFLVGDIFDFWFEYKHAIPKGFVRLQGKIAEITDAGIPVHVFTGNHDMWIFDYLPKELGFHLHRAPIVRQVNGKKLYIGHGDGLGPGDRGYKFIKKVFDSRLSQWMFARLHPNFGIWLASYFSKSSRAASIAEDKTFLGKENEWLFQYCQEIHQKEHFDHYIFGHRHLPLRLRVAENSTYLNLGDWINYRTFARFDGELTFNRWVGGEVKEYDFPEGLDG
jgi:UDP-2,3-diacylglucosamine hydrolase